MAQEEKGFKPNFDNGGFWDYYKDIERQFESFLEYVPYLKDNENTYSFRLANIILAIGARAYRQNVYTFDLLVGSSLHVYSTLLKTLTIEEDPNSKRLL